VKNENSTEAVSKQINNNEDKKYKRLRYKNQRSAQKDKFPEIEMKLNINETNTEFRNALGSAGKKFNP